MGKKIKNFICNSIGSISAVEKQINEFGATHNILDIKVCTTVHKPHIEFLVIYTVIYQED